MVPLKKVLCPVDFSGLSKAALKSADEMAAHFGAQLWVLHVVPARPLIECPSPYPGMVACVAPEYQHAVQDRAKGRIEAMLKQLDLKTPDVMPVVRSGKTVDEIVQLAAREEIDLIIMGTLGLAEWHQNTFGSIAGKVMHLAQCPVLIVPIVSADSHHVDSHRDVSRRGARQEPKHTTASAAHVPFPPSTRLKDKMAGLLKLVSPALVNHQSRRRYQSRKSMSRR